MPGDGTLAVAPRTRTQLIERLNHVLSPTALNTVGTTAPLNGVALDSGSKIEFNYDKPLFGNVAGRLINTSGNAGVKLLDASMSALQIGVGATYTLSLYVYSPTVGMANPQLHIVGPGFDYVIGASSTKQQWIRYQKTFVATSSGSIQAYLNFDSNQANANCLFDCLQIDDGAIAQPFFCGAGRIQPDSSAYYGWLGTTGYSLSKRYTLDPSEVTYPVLVENGFHAGKDNGNILHRTLQNQLVVVRRLATLSIGTLNLFYASRLEAFTQYSLFDRLDDFQWIDNQNPETGMFFAVSGRVLIDQVPESPTRWRLAVPFEQTA